MIHNRTAEGALNGVQYSNNESRMSDTDTVELYKTETANDLSTETRDKSHIGHNKIVITGLPYSVNDEILKELFLSFGEVRSAHVYEGVQQANLILRVLDQFKMSTGTGLVHFKTTEAAKKAMELSHMLVVLGRKLDLKWDKI